MPTRPYWTVIRAIASLFVAAVSAPTTLVGEARFEPALPQSHPPLACAPTIPPLPSRPMVLSNPYSTGIMRLRTHELRSGLRVSRLAGQQLLNGGFDVLGGCAIRLPLVPQHGPRLRNRRHGVTQPGDHLLRFDSCVPALPREVDVVGIVGIVYRNG